MSHNKFSADWGWWTEHLDMSSEKSGLILSRDCANTENPYERLALEVARKYEATAVYFRRFDNGRPPIPQIYIYDFTVDIKKDKLQIAELHKRLWNAGQVPLFFIFTKTDVKIFNCIKHPTYSEEKKEIQYSPFTTLEAIQIASEIKTAVDTLRSFSAPNFDNGTFWENPLYSNEFQVSESAYEKLLQELKVAKKEIVKNNILPKSIAQKLLVMSILVKYLEEREDDDGKTVFTQESDNFFEQFGEASNFIELLRISGACLDLFDKLSEHFNGEIFKWDNQTERDLLRNADLRRFAMFLEGKTEGYQYVLWRLYSFNDLPIELVSNIYEEFLEAKAGVVYTPPYLVNFLIDECMPLDKPKLNFKVLDPSCGSGIFLVAAFRRIVYWWMSQNGWKPPKSENLTDLKNLLKNNIYGVDINPEAVRLTVFSLCLALCDMLSPKVIWEKLKFDNLIEQNIFARDFFELIEKDIICERFDLIIGNPPFISIPRSKSESAQNIELKQKKYRPEIPNKQIALLFLEQAMNLSKSTGLVCLILPSSAFLYNTHALKFRKYFLEQYNVPQITDFTHIARILFGKRGDIGTLAVFVQNIPPNENDILHLTIRRTKAVKEKLYFEIDKYDFYHVPKGMALKDRFIWKANYLGGGRLHYHISKLASLRTLKEFLDEKISQGWCLRDALEEMNPEEIERLEDYIKNEDDLAEHMLDDFRYLRQKYDRWAVGEGYKIGNRSEISQLVEYKRNREVLSASEKKKLERLEKKYKRASFLTGQKALPTQALTEKGIHREKIFTLKEEFFSDRRIEKIYEAPHVLIKELVGTNSLPIDIAGEYLVHPRRITGIHAPESQIAELKKIKTRIQNNRICLFYITAFSGEYLVNKATSCLKTDLDHLPYPEKEEDLELSEIEQVLLDDVLNYMRDFRSKGERSRAVAKPTTKQLKQFGDMYCTVLNSVYKNFEPHPPVFFRTNSFVCYPFYFGEKPHVTIADESGIEEHLTNLLIETCETANLRIVRVLTLYEENVIYIVKPNQVRYWLRSVAIRDADETAFDLFSQGY